MKPSATSGRRPLGMHDALPHAHAVESLEHLVATFGHFTLFALHPGDSDIQNSP